MPVARQFDFVNSKLNNLKIKFSAQFKSYNVTIPRLCNKYSDNKQK